MTYDLTQESLSIFVGGIIKVMIKKNTPIPTEHTETFTTFKDNQKKISIGVLMGENKIANLNTFLGEFIFEGIQPAPKMVPQIDVTFAIDANGILNVTAKENATGKENSITITSFNKMSDEEIERKKAEAKERAEEDERRFKLAKLKNDADATIYTARSLIEDSNFNLDAETKSNIEELITDLQMAIMDENTTSIMIQMKKLKDAVADAGSSLY